MLVCVVFRWEIMRNIHCQNDVSPVNWPENIFCRTKTMITKNVNMLLDLFNIPEYNVKQSKKYESWCAKQVFSFLNFFLVLTQCLCRETFFV